MGANWISQRLGQFAYFDAELAHPDWANKRVLDFGGNVGNLLLDPNCTIEVRNYWSLDVSRPAVEAGRRRHPGAHFVHYDCYNSEFNPTGVPGLAIPDLGVSFDVIVAWSVFTHLSQAETVKTVSRLRDMLAPGGQLAFSFIDPRWTPPEGWARPEELPGLSNLRWRLERRREASPQLDVEGLARRVENAAEPLTWLTLVDDDLFLDPDDAAAAGSEPSSSYLTFCTGEHLATILPGVTVRPPVRPDRLRCAVIGGR